jgi:hypothetical protein
MSPGRVPIAVRRALVASGTVGLVVTVAGTFLPWLGSGTAERNSYAAGGAVRRLLTLSRPLHDVLGAWPLLGVLAAVAVAAVLLGQPAAGLALGTIVAVVAGGCAAAVLPVHGTRYAHVLREGPVTTLSGAMLVGLTTLISLVLVFARRPR